MFRCDHNHMSQRLQSQLSAAEAVSATSSKYNDPQQAYSSAEHDIAMMYDGVREREMEAMVSPTLLSLTLSDPLVSMLKFIQAKRDKEKAVRILIQLIGKVSDWLLSIATSAIISHRCPHRIKLQTSWTITQ